MDALNKLISNKGTVIVNDTAEYVADAVRYVANEATVIARIEINGDTGTDVKAAYVTAAASAIGKDARLVPQGDDYFSAITLTSGSVEVTLK